MQTPIRLYSCSRCSCFLISVDGNYRTLKLTYIAITRFVTRLSYNGILIVPHVIWCLLVLCLYYSLIFDLRSTLINWYIKTVVQWYFSPPFWNLPAAWKTFGFTILSATTHEEPALPFPSVLRHLSPSFSILRSFSILSDYLFSYLIFPFPSWSVLENFWGIHYSVSHCR